MERADVYKFFADKGYQPHHIAGIMGNIGAESAFDPAAFNPAGGGQGAYGLAQWRGPRQSALRDLAKTRGTDVNDGMTQLVHMYNELQSTEKAANEALLKTNNAADAAKVFRDMYERPGGHGYKNTHDIAMEVAANYGAAPGEYTQAFRMPEQFAAPAGEVNAYGMPTMLDPGQLDMGVLADEMARNDMRQDILEGFLPSDGGLPSFASTEYADPQVVQTMPSPLGPLPMGDGKVSDPELERLKGMMDAEAEGPSALRSPDEFQYGEVEPEILTEAENVVTSQAESILSAPQDYDTGTVEGAASILDEPDDTDEEKTAKANRRRTWATMLATLSKGLGQMSVGQAVDVTGVPMEFERMEMEQQAQDNRNRLANIQEARLGQQLDLDQQKFLSQQQGTEREAQARAAAAKSFAANGQVELAQMAMAGVPLESVFEAARDDRFRAEDRATALADRQDEWQRDDYEFWRERNADVDDRQYEEDLAQRQGAAIQNALGQMAQGVPLHQIDPSGLSPAAYNTLQDLTQKPEKMQIAEQIAADTGKSVGEVLYEMGTKPLVDQSTKAESAGDTEAAEKLAGRHDTNIAELKEQARITRESDTLLAEFDMLNQELMAADASGDVGGRESVITKYTAEAEKVLKSFGMDRAATLVNEVGGVSGADWARMNTLEKGLAFAIARENRGQGSITENERAQILQQVARGGIDRVARQEIIKRSQMLNAVDRLVYDQYLQGTSGENGYRNADAAMGNLVNNIEPAVAGFSTALTALTRIQAGVPKSRDKAYLLPKLSKQQVEILGPIMQDFGIPGYTTPGGKKMKWD